MFNDLFLLQIVLILFSLLFLSVTNTMLIWYLILFFLFLISFILFIDNFDIFVGFLLLIDLGVILIFLVFVFHFINFLDNKHNFKLYSYIPGSFIFFLFLKLVWNNGLVLDFFYPSFYISWYDYFSFLYLPYKTDLNLLKEIYFYNNSFEFVLINFFILYGLFSSILFFFIIKKMYLIDFVSWLKVKFFLSSNNSFFYIRNQNLINQQDEGASLKILNKRK